MEIDESELVKNAILKTLKYLKLREPKCICEQCEFGYKFDENSKNKCEDCSKKIEKIHNIWESKILYWKERLRNAK